MRVLIATVGGRGDVAPFTGLGTAMRAAGHSVTIATADMFQHGMGLQLQPMTPTREFPPSSWRPGRWAAWGTGPPGGPPRPRWRSDWPARPERSAGS